MPKPKKIPRDTRNLIITLKGHLELLREYRHRAFILNDPRFPGEVAGKLRILIYRSPSNRPLLLKINGTL